MKQFFPAGHAVPISKAVRAGDLVFTSAYGPWLFQPLDLTYDEAGNVIDDGTGNGGMSLEEQIHRTFDFIKEALAVAGCTLADVISCECWLSDARDFVAFDAIYESYFPSNPPVRSVFPMRFNFNCKVEMKVVAYKPLTG